MVYRRWHERCSSKCGTNGNQKVRASNLECQCDTFTEPYVCTSNRGCEMFVVREGWEGLVRGNETEAIKRPTKPINDFIDTYGEGELLKEGEAEMALKGRHIIRVGWDDVRGYATEGGTLIGTARSAAFREKEGRTKAALNLVKHGIDALVVCGGDGSLTGADKLRAEWPDHLAELVKSGIENITLAFPT